MIKAPEVSGWLHKNFDLCFVIETHMTKGEKFDLEGFKCLTLLEQKVTEQKNAGTNCRAKILRDFATFCSRDFLFSDFARH